MLGTELVSFFKTFSNYEVFGLGRTATDNLLSQNQYIFNLENFRFNNLKEKDFDIIIHTAALTNLDICENDLALATKINIDATKEFSKLAKYNNAKLIYISTDSVFDGAKGNYNEKDKPAPLNNYSYTKYKGEEEILKINENNSIVVRTNIYGVNQPFRNTIVEWAIKEWSNNKQINGFEDVKFNALYTGQLAEILKKIIETNFNEKIINIGSSEYLSKYDFLNKLRTKLGYKEDLLKKVNTSKLVSKIKRPLNTTLNTSKLETIIIPPSFDNGISKLVSKL